jgi:integrase
MASASASRRSHGTGSLLLWSDANGRAQWYGKWRRDGRQVKRKLGPKRAAGTSHGLTRAQAERELRRVMDEVAADPVVEELSLEEAGRRHVDRLELLGRKRSTLMDYRSTLRVHLVPFFGDVPIAAITTGQIERYLTVKLRAGRAPKSIRNDLGLLYGVLGFAEKRGWVASNPCKHVELPRAGTHDDGDIRYLSPEEVEALCRAVPDDDLGCTERLLYRVAAMTGLRQGELLALRWRDVDWPAGRVRVRRSLVRGEFGTPKSRRASRSVPLADALAAALDAHQRASAYPSDDHLVFAHPHLGRPIDRSKLLKRYKAAVRRAGIRDVRFHDLRHTFGTRMAAAGVPMRTLQEWMGHRDFKTTLIYADYAPSAQEREFVERAFAPAVVGHPPNVGRTRTEMT